MQHVVLMEVRKSRCQFNCESKDELFVKGLRLDEFLEVRATKFSHDQDVSVE